MSRHPARRARRVTAVISATAFAGIAGSLAATHAGAAPSTHPRPATTPTTSAVPGGGSGGQSGQVDDGSGLGFSGGGWSASPGDPGQDQSSGQVPTDHGQSGAS